MKLLDKPTLAWVSKFWNVIVTPFIWRNYKLPYLSPERLLPEADYQALRKNAHHIQDLSILQLTLAEAIFGYLDPRLNDSRPLVTCVNLKTLRVSCKLPESFLDGTHWTFFRNRTVNGTRFGDRMYPLTEVFRQNIPPHVEAGLLRMIQETPSIKTIWLLKYVSSPILDDIMVVSMNRDLDIQTMATLLDPTHCKKQTPLLNS